MRNWFNTTGTCTLSTTLDCAALVFAGATPNTLVLACFQCPFQAGFNHRATPTNSFCFLDLGERRSGISDREEEFRILFAADCLMAPVHLNLQSLENKRFFRP